MIPDHILDELLQRAFREDIGSGDLTSQYVVPSTARGEGRLLAKEEGLLAGLEIAASAFRFLDQGVECDCLLSDGSLLKPGCEVMKVSGPLQSLLTSERTALNLLQRLSGIATLTALWVKEIEGYRAKLADTRKTTPGLRLPEKYAVRVGGAVNHRFALDGGILIKDNHITAAGGIAEAVRAARENAPYTLRIEVEVTCLQELEEALEAKADIIMLDNMSTEHMARAVELTAGQALLEASGNIILERLREVAATGVDFISCGALTHSSRALDFSFLLNS